MTNNDIIITLCLVYFIITGLIIVSRNFDIDFLNPLENYENWDTMNWFGIGVVTTLLNVIFLPYAIIYWICKLIRWSCTVGRK